MSTLTPRENYLRAVRREEPAWVPFYLGFTPGALAKFRAATGREDCREFFQFPWQWISFLRREGAALPDLVLVDGGITQLRAARKELELLGLKKIPCAGLAKRYEEIYWGDGKTPICLPRDSAGLKVLQQLRDEAHRFALTYHRRLRNQRIKESMLDEIPGVGAKRKKALIEHFGSVRRVEKATAAEIAEVPGVGPQMAYAIYERLSV